MAQPQRLEEQLPVSTADTNGGEDNQNSILGKMKGKAKRFKVKVQNKYMKGHGESVEEESAEEQDEPEAKPDKNVEDVTNNLAGLDAFGTQDTPIPNKSSKDEMPMNENKNPNEEFLTHAKETEPGSGKRGNAITERDEIETYAGEATGEDTEYIPDLPKGKQQEDQGGEENFTSSKVKEPSSGIEDDIKEPIASVDDYDFTTPEKAEPEGGVGHASENFREYPSEKTEEESQSSLKKAQDKSSEVGGNSVDPFDTQSAGEGEELTSNDKPPNFTEEGKSGGSEIGYGVMSNTSGLPQGSKDSLTFDQNGNDNVKDTVIEGERKGTEDEGTQKQQSEAEAGESYAQKFYDAKNNVIEPSKPGHQSPNMGAKENKENSMSTPVAELSPGEDEKAEVTSSSTTDANMEASKQDSSNPSEGVGIVGRVTGVVTSFFGKKQSEDEPIGEVQREKDLETVPKPEMQPTGKSEGQTGESIPMEEDGKY